MFNVNQQVLLPTFCPMCWEKLKHSSQTTRNSWKTPCLLTTEKSQSWYCKLLTRHSSSGRRFTFHHPLLCEKVTIISPQQGLELSESPAAGWSGPLDALQTSSPCLWGASRIFDWEETKSGLHHTNHRENTPKLAYSIKTSKIITIIITK